MTLTHIFKLLIRHVAMLIGVPLFMAGIVYVLTSNGKREYETSTVIYTGIASGYSIESGASTKVDYFAANNAFDNLINIITSRNTMEEAALRLFARTAKTAALIPAHISAEHHQDITSSLPDTIRQILDTGTEDEQLLKLREYMSMSDTNYIYRLLNMNHPHYSITALSNIKVSRISNSDLLEMQFKSDDPGICQQTLVLMNAVFAANHKSLKGNQTDMVVKYFEAQLAKANALLRASEDELLQFNKQNNIINYYEQTKYIASQKEDLDLEYQREQMKMAGAKAAIAQLEAKMGFQYRMKLQNKQLLDSRSQLAQLSSKLSLIHMVKGDSSALVSQMDAVKLKMRNTVDSLQTLAHTAEGVSMDDIIGNWLKQIIIYEETNAKIQVLENRRAEFRTIYRQFAPLGATIKRIERAIDVREREYLSLLHSLALAKLKQQNIELSSNLKLVDPPYFPINPLPSKRIFLVILAALSGFVFLFGVLVALELLDTNIRTAARLQMFTNLTCSGTYPRVDKNSAPFLNKAIPKINTLMIQQMLNYREENSMKSFVILSPEKEEGKSAIASQLAGALANKTTQTVLIGEKNEIFGQTGSADFIALPDDVCLSTIPSVQELIPSEKQYHFVFIELPAATANNTSPQLIKEAEKAFIVFRANRGFTPADKKTISNIEKIAPGKTECILNATDMEALEDEIGVFPKNRSLLRKKLKKLLSFHHYEKETITGGGK